MSTPSFIRIPSAVRAGRGAGREWAMLLALLVLLSACAETPERGTGSGVAPASDARSIQVLAADTFGVLLDRLEPMFERDHPGVDLVVTYGIARPPLDGDQTLIRAINAGQAIDVLLVDDAERLQRLTRPPSAVTPWLSNRLVLIRTRGTGLRLIDLSTGVCEVSVALERTALGRATREALRARGVWSGLSGRVGLFDDGRAIMTRVASERFEPALGIVFASDAASSGRSIAVVAVLDAGGVEHVAATWTADGRLFARWLRSDQALGVAIRLGFSAAVDARASTPTNRSR